MTTTATENKSTAATSQILADGGLVEKRENQKEISVNINIAMANNK